MMISLDLELFHSFAPALNHFLHACSFYKFTGACCGRRRTLRWCRCRTCPRVWAGRRACRDGHRAEITEFVRLVWLPGMLCLIITNQRRPSSNYCPMRDQWSDTRHEETDNSFPLSLISVLCSGYNSDRRDIKLHYHVLIVLEQQTRRINPACASQRQWRLNWWCCCQSSIFQLNDNLVKLMINRHHYMDNFNKQRSECLKKYFPRLRDPGSCII